MRAEGRAIEAEDALESEQAHVQADNAFAAARRRAVADQRKAAAERTLRENAEDEQRKVDREKERREAEREGEQREQREQREKVRQQRLGWVGLEDTLGFSWLGQKKRAKTSLSIVRCPFSDVRVTAVQSAHS